MKDEDVDKVLSDFINNKFTNDEPRTQERNGNIYFILGMLGFVSGFIAFFIMVFSSMIWYGIGSLAGSIVFSMLLLAVGRLIDDIESLKEELKNKVDKDK